jgi:hypothetical protein
MQIRLYSNELEAPVSPFVGRYIANVCLAIVKSLKTAEVKIIRFHCTNDQVCLEIDSSPVPLGLNQGFAERLVRDTLQGVVKHLKSMEPEGQIRIEIDSD